MTRGAVRSATWPGPAAVAEVVGAMTPVDLPELNRRAGLMSRADRKYLVPGAEVPGLLARLAEQAEVLQIDGLRSFDYQSDYHDSEELRCFLDAAHHRRLRYKVRARRYLGTGADFLEVKTPAGRGTVKQRMTWSGRRLDAEGWQFVRQTLAGAGIEEPPPLRPTLRTSYRRTTLLLPLEGARVTLDEDLSWLSLRDGGRQPLAGLWVIETKTPSGPCAADRLLWAAAHRPLPLSKYATGMATLDPTLPRNRWHRILTTAADHARATPAEEAS